MKYLVPFDFTEITKIALEHALKFSETDNGKIEVLHIISDEKERVAANQKFDELLESLDSKYLERITCKVREGNIFKDIAKEANEGGSDLMVMGTHGAKGLQKILGSHAIKVITSSGTPFVVTQSKKPTDQLNCIVLPVNLSNEKVQIAGFAGDIAKKFDAEVHIVLQPEKDEFLIKKLNSNILKVKRKLSSMEIKYKVQMLEGKSSFYKEMMDYGVSCSADMFAVGYYPETLFPQFEKFSQELITNELKLPVLIVNVEEIAGIKKNYSFLGN